MFGVLATLVGVATGHFVASLLNPASSPVLAVGSQVIDLTPTPMKEWAIRQFGDKDKTILVGSVHGRGARARRRRRAADRCAASGSAPACWSCSSRSPASPPMNRPAAELVDLSRASRPPITGVAALWFLDRTARHAARRPADEAAASPPSTRWSTSCPGEPSRSATAPVAPRRARRDRRARRRRGGPGRRRPLHRQVPHPARGHRAPPADRPGPGVPDRARRPGTPASRRSGSQRRLLPRRHPPGHPDRRRRTLDADHRRRRRQGGHASPSTTS